MTGFVTVISVGADQTTCLGELDGLARQWERLRGQTGVTVGNDRGGAVSFGATTVADDSGWTVRLGVAHGVLTHPVNLEQLAETDGQYCIVSQDSESGSTIVATDRFAAAPVYVARRAGVLLASTSAMVLAAHLRAEPDPRALRDFLVSGYQFGPETHWRGVTRLEPGAAKQVSGDRVVDHEYWMPQADEGLAALSLQQFAGHAIELSVSVLGDRLQGGSQPHWVDLTGGYDSRLLALLLARAGVQFTTNTRQVLSGPDLVRAQAIAEMAGWEWRPVLIPPQWEEILPDEVEHALVAAHGRLEVLQLSRVSWMHRKLASRGGSLLSAGGGEHFQYAAWKTELFRPWGRHPNIERWVDMMGLRPAETSVLAPGSRDATRDAYVEKLRSRVNRFRDQPMYRQLDACFAYKNGRHVGGYRAADDTDIRAQLPFYFEPIFSLAVSAPRRYRNGFCLMRAMMERLDPRVAAVPTTRGGPALPMRFGTFPQYAPYYASLGRKGVNKVVGRFSGHPVCGGSRRVTWPEEDSVAGGVAALEERGSLDWTQLRARPLLSPEGVNRLRRTAVPPTMMGRFLTVEMALAATDASL